MWSIVIIPIDQCATNVYGYITAPGNINVHLHLRWFLWNINEWNLGDLSRCIAFFIDLALLHRPGTRFVHEVQVLPENLMWLKNSSLGSSLPKKWNHVSCVAVSSFYLVVTFSCKRTRQLWSEWISFRLAAMRYLSPLWDS